MNRRQVLLTMGAAGAALLIPKPSFGQEVQEPQPSGILISGEIGNNHGHAFSLSAEDALRLLRATKLSGQPVLIDIQGASGHPHAVELSFEDLLLLFTEGALSEVSTVGAGHTHGVQIVMTV